MKKILPLFICSIIQYLAIGQTIIHRDVVIQDMVKEVSADSLQSYINAMVGFGTRNTLNKQKESNRGIASARDYVLAKFNEFAKGAGARMTAMIDTTTIAADGKRINAPTLLGNVMATLQGTDTYDKRIFMISGHLDSRASDVMNSTIDAPGANDDGSGVAAVLECARIMSKRSFPATIIFVAVSGEEQGLLGSGYLAKKAKQEGWQLEALLNNDIMGSNNSNETNIIDNTRLRVFSEGLPAFELDKNAMTIRNLGLENDGKARQLARYVKETGERYVDHLEVVLIYRNDRFLRGGDHTPFVQNGFAAVRITEMNENYNRQHQDIRMENGIQYGDLPGFIDKEYLRKNTAINLASLANLAKAPSTPQKVKIDVKNLSNSTVLHWKPSATGKVIGYYILLRETTAPVWQKKIFTNESEMTLPYSKDNYFFAVQSISEDGNESLAVVPELGK